MTADINFADSIEGGLDASKVYILVQTLSREPSVSISNTEIGLFDVTADRYLDAWGDYACVIFTNDGRFAYMPLSDVEGLEEPYVIDARYALYIVPIADFCFIDNYSKNKLGFTQVSVNQPHNLHVLYVPNGTQAGSLHHFKFDWSPPTSEKLGVPFSVTIEADDSFGNIVDFNGTINLILQHMDSCVPVTIQFTDGSCTVDVTISGVPTPLYTSVYLECFINIGGNQYFGASGGFAVVS